MDNAIYDIPVTTIDGRACSLAMKFSLAKPSIMPTSCPG